MHRTNRHWLPAYCNPDSYLPKVQETRALFSTPPFGFWDFVGRALTFLQGDLAKEIGFVYDLRNILPCKWKCADEAVFSVDLALYAHTGRFPFDKGMIGGRFNSASLGAAVHHGSINLDFGGSHVGYEPGESGGRFGRIWRPLHRGHSTDCGYLCAVIEPFRRVYEDACNTIVAFRPPSEKVFVSVPNEYVQPSWSNNPVKLLVDTDTLTDGEVKYDPHKPYTQTPIGRTLFYLKPGLLERLDEDEAQHFRTPQHTPMGKNLSYPFFNIFNTESPLDEHGLPQQRLELYMKYILSARNSPPELKAAIVNTNLEYNRLTDAVREPEFEAYSFASFTGVFVDMYDEEGDRYRNLFQPLGVSIKPAGTTSLTELPQHELYEIFSGLAPTPPLRSAHDVLGLDSSKSIVEKFTFRPSYFERREAPRRTVTS